MNRFLFGDELIGHSLSSCHIESPATHDKLKCIGHWLSYSCHIESPATTRQTKVYRTLVEFVESFRMH